MRAAMRPGKTSHKDSLASEKTKETSSQTDRYFLESVRQHHLDLNARWVHEFENIKRIEGNLLLLSATFKF